MSIILEFLDIIQSQIDEIDQNFNLKDSDFEKRLRNYNPLSIVLATILILVINPYIRIFLWSVWKKIDSLEKLKSLILKFAMNFSFARKLLSKEKAGINKTVQNQFQSNVIHVDDFTFENEPKSEKHIIEALDKLYELDGKKLKHHQMSGTLYVGENEIEEISKEVSTIFTYSDLKSPETFPAARFIESKLIKIGVDLFKGQTTEACGLTSTGGTESIMMAVFSYRNLALARGIKEPELICSYYTHAAFNKACEIYNVKYIEIGVDKNHRIDLVALKKNINSNTMLIVGNYPNFPNGVEDPITELSEICIKNQIPLHIDGCLGGMIAAFSKDAGIPVTPLTFDIQGITSISCDFHKYGLSPKGISILIYRSPFYRRFQFFKYDKMDGPHLSPGFANTKNAAFISASLAVLISRGRNYYVNQAKVIYQSIQKIIEFTKINCPKLSIIGDPKICVISFNGEKAAVIFEFMKKREWDLCFCLAPLGSFHLALTLSNVRNIENNKFMNDLKESYDLSYAKNCPQATSTLKLYGLSKAIPKDFAQNNLDIIVDNMID